MSKQGAGSISPSEMIYIFQNWQISELEGKVLTFIDASVADAVQRKALKDLLRPMIWEWAMMHNKESFYELKSKIA